jgi:hypothetical protein
MNRKPNVQRLAGKAQALPDKSPTTLALPAPDLDQGQLAREMDCSLAAELNKYRHARDAESGRPDPSQPAPEWFVESILNKRPEDVSFYDLERLARIDPTKSTARWEEVKAAAQRDLSSGWLAGRALEVHGGSAWERACFGALRRNLRESWPPRNEGEALLIDEMAQYELMRQCWLGIVSMISHQPAISLSLQSRCENGDEEKRALAANTLIAALRMVERFQRLYQNSLRSLQNLRRAKSALFVGKVGQVNVTSGPQMNVNAQAAE